MPTTTNAEIQAQQLPLFFWQNPVKHIANLPVQIFAMNQGIRLNPWSFVYLVLLLHKEVFPQVVGLCIFFFLILEVVVYCLVIAHLLVVSSQPLHDDTSDVNLFLYGQRTVFR